MVKAENPHWNEVFHAEPFTWVTFMLMQLDGDKKALGQERQHVVADHLTASADTGVRQLLLRVEPLTHYVGLSLVVEAGDTEQALQTSVKAAMGGLAHAAVDLGYVSVRESRIAEAETLIEECQKGVITDIRHPHFKIDPAPINALFREIAPPYIEVATLEASFAMPELSAA